MASKAKGSKATPAEAKVKATVERLDEGDVGALLEYLEAAGGKKIGPSKIRVRPTSAETQAAAG